MPNASPSFTDSLFYKLILLWFAGVSMRVTVIAVPPLLPQISQDLALSPTAIGMLNSVPSLLFALAAIPGAALIARFGALPAMLTGLSVTAIMGAARGFSPNTTMLFATTFVMSTGIAIMQPALPTLVRAWMPKRIGLATSVFSNGTMGSEALAGSITIPLILPLLLGSWRWSLAFWSLPVVIAIALVILQVKTGKPLQMTIQGHDKRSWWPDWRHSIIWKIGLITGAESGLYFCLNSFLPGLLEHSGDSHLISGALAAINIGQIPPTILLLFFGQKLAVKRSAYALFGLAILISTVAIMLMPASWTIFWCTIIGLCCGFVATIAFMLPAIMGEARNVHRMAGGIFTISYLFGMLIPAFGGILWDMSQRVTLAFLPAAFCGLIIALLGATIQFKHAFIMR